MFFLQSLHINLKKSKYFEKKIISLHPISSLEFMQEKKKERSVIEINSNYWIALVFVTIIIQWLTGCEIIKVNHCHSFSQAFFVCCLSFTVIIVQKHSANFFLLLPILHVWMLSLHHVVCSHSIVRAKKGQLFLLLLLLLFFAFFLSTINLINIAD